MRNFARQEFFLDGLGFGDLPLLFLQMKQGFFSRPGFFLGAAAQFAALASQADLLAEDFQKPRVGPGLLHKVAYAKLHGFHGEAHGGPAGHRDDRRSVLDFPQTAEHIQSFAAGGGVARIVEIDEENIELLAAYRRQQVRRRIDGFDAVAVPFEQQAQRVEHVLLVVSNQNSRLHGFASR